MTAARDIKSETREKRQPGSIHAAQNLHTGPRLSAGSPGYGNYLQRCRGNSYLQSFGESGHPFEQTVGTPVIQRKCVCGGSCASCRGEGEEFRRIQAKLTIGPPNDMYEQEADRVADRVMRMPEPRVQRRVEPDEEEGEDQMVQTKPIFTQITPLIQRQAEPEEEDKEEDEIVQTKSLSSQITPIIQREAEPEEEEKEEDEVVQTKALSSQITPIIQRQTEPEADEKDEDEMVQTKSLSSQITPIIQRETEPDAEEKDEDEMVQTKSLSPHINPIIQREAEPEAEEKDEDEVQTKSLSPQINPIIQREAACQRFHVSS